MTEQRQMFQIEQTQATDAAPTHSTYRTLRVGRRQRSPESVLATVFCCLSALAVLLSIFGWWREQQISELLQQGIDQTLAEQTETTDGFPQIIHLHNADDLSLAFQYYDSLAKEQTVPDGAHPVLSRDLSGQGDSCTLMINNQTNYSPDSTALLAQAVSAQTDGVQTGEPLVLILHTHGTESYRPTQGLWYNDDQKAFRSTDTSENVVAVGEVMRQVFEENGIPCIHCTVMHDAESYNDSYDLAAETISAYLKKYPSIRYVFDIHRDAISDGQDGIIRCVTDVEGQATAQVMFVVGSDEKGANHPNWQSNLALALKLQWSLNSKYPHLARPISLRGAAYNQTFTTGSFLIEIGSTGNTLSESKRAAVYTAQALCDIISPGTSS